MEVLVDVVVLVVERVFVVEAVLVVLKEYEVDFDVLPCANATGVTTKHRILAQAAVFMAAASQRGGVTTIVCTSPRWRIIKVI